MRSGRSATAAEPQHTQSIQNSAPVGSGAYQSCPGGQAGRLARTLTEPPRRPADLARETLLRFSRVAGRARWSAAVDLPAPDMRGFVFDRLLAMAEATAQGVDVPLLPTRMFERDLRQGRLVRPFAAEAAVGTIGSPA